MGLESATFIDGLAITNPVASDSVAQGDDHLRLIKAALKSSFPDTTRARYLEQARADLASATSPDLWATTTNYVNITGTTQIDDFVDGVSGQSRLVRFDDVLTLTHGASAIVLPTGANIITAAGDHAIFVNQGASIHVCVAYFRASGFALQETEISAADLQALEYGLHTQWIPAGAMRPHHTLGATPSEYDGLDILYFNENDVARFAIKMPKSWKHDSELYFRPVWLVDTGGSAATVVFSLAAVAMGDGDDYSNTYGTAETSSDTWTANDRVHYGALSDPLTPGGTPAREDLLNFQLTRSEAGTLSTSVEVGLLGIELLYEIDLGNDNVA